MKQQLKTALYVLAAIMAFIDVIRGCSVMFEHFKPLNSVQRMERFDIMAYGKYMDTQWNYENYETEGTFHVECTLKNDDPENPLPSTIKIKNPISMNSCDATFVMPGSSYLAGLTRGKNGTFEFQRFLLQSSALRATSGVMRLAASMCSMDQIQMPQGRSLTESPACKKMNDIAGSIPACIKARPIDDIYEPAYEKEGDGPLSPSSVSSENSNSHVIADINPVIEESLTDTENSESHVVADIHPEMKESLADTLLEASSIWEFEP